MLKRAVVGVKLRRVCLKTSLCLRAVKSHEFGKFAHIASCREALKQTPLRGALYVKMSCCRDQTREGLSETPPSAQQSGDM